MIPQINHLSQSSKDAGKSHLSSSVSHRSPLQSCLKSKSSPKRNKGRPCLFDFTRSPKTVRNGSHSPKKNLTFAKQNSLSNGSQSSRAMGLAVDTSGPLTLSSGLPRSPAQSPTLRGSISMGGGRTSRSMSTAIAKQRSDEEDIETKYARLAKAYYKIKRECERMRLLQTTMEESYHRKEELYREQIEELRTLQEKVKQKNEARDKYRSWRDEEFAKRKAELNKEKKKKNTPKSMSDLEKNKEEMIINSESKDNEDDSDDQDTSSVIALIDIIDDDTVDIDTQAGELIGETKALHAQLLERMEVNDQQVEERLRQTMREQDAGFQKKIRAMEKQLRDEKTKNIQGSEEWVNKYQALTKEVNWIKDIANKIEEENEKLQHNNSVQQHTLASLGSDREFLIKQVIALKKENKQLHSLLGEQRRMYQGTTDGNGQFATGLQGNGSSLSRQSSRSQSAFKLASLKLSNGGVNRSHSSLNRDGSQTTRSGRNSSSSKSQSSQKSLTSRDISHSSLTNKSSEQQLSGIDNLDHPYGYSQNNLNNNDDKQQIQRVSISEHENENTNEEENDKTEDMMIVDESEQTTDKSNATLIRNNNNMEMNLSERSIFSARNNNNNNHLSYHHRRRPKGDAKLMEHVHNYNVPLCEVDKKYEQVISHLRKQLHRERIKNEEMMMELSNEKAGKTQLQLLFRQCVEDVRFELETLQKSKLRKNMILNHQITNITTKSGAQSHRPKSQKTKKKNTVMMNRPHSSSNKNNNNNDDNNQYLKKISINPRQFETNKILREEHRSQCIEKLLMKEKVLSAIYNEMFPNAKAMKVIFKKQIHRSIKKKKKENNNNKQTTTLRLSSSSKSLLLSSMKTNNNNDHTIYSRSQSSSYLSNEPDLKLPQYHYQRITGLIGQNITSHTHR